MRYVRATDARPKAELMKALCDVGHKLDVATPVEMKALITARKRITARLQALAPPSLRIFRQ